MDPFAKGIAMLLRRPKSRSIFLIYIKKEDPRTYRQDLFASGHIEQKGVFECKLRINFRGNISMHKNFYFFVWGLETWLP